jgi:hypothetical protein
MKKLILFSLLSFTIANISFSQAEKEPNISQFTRDELLAFKDVKTLLSAINKDKDYSMYWVRNFKLTTTITNPDNTKTVLSEMGPGGIFSEQQIALIEKYAKKGATFTIEDLTMIEHGKKGVITMENISFVIKE